MRTNTTFAIVAMCVASLTAGCWAELDANGTLVWYGAEEFRLREEFLEQTQPERFAEMRSKRNTGQLLAGVGIGCDIYAIVTIMSASGVNPPSDDEVVVAQVLGVAGAALLIVGINMSDDYEPWVKRGGRNRSELIIAPNGAALAFRF